MKNAFMLHADFFDEIRNLDASAAFELFEALMSSTEDDGYEVTLTPELMVLYRLITRQNLRFSGSQQGRGGAPSGNQNAAKQPKQPKQPSVSISVSESVGRRTKDERRETKDERRKNNNGGTAEEDGTLRTREDGGEDAGTVVVAENLSGKSEKPSDTPDVDATPEPVDAVSELVNATPETASATPRGDPELGRVMSAYMDNIGSLPAAMATEGLRDYCAQMGADVVIHAIDVAAAAGKRNWRYIGGILRSWRANGVKTLDEAHANSARASPQTRASPPAKEYPPDSKPHKAAAYLANRVRENYPTNGRVSAEKLPETLQSWAAVFDLMLSSDARPPNELLAVLQFSQDDDFYRPITLTADAFRRNYDAIMAKCAERTAE
jgi:DnaD/phage-associated family protein